MVDYEIVERILKSFKEKHIANNELEQTIDLHLLGLKETITCELTETYKNYLSTIPGVLYATVDGKGLIRLKVDNCFIDEFLKEI